VVGGGWGGEAGLECFKLGLKFRLRSFPGRPSDFRSKKNTHPKLLGFTKEKEGGKI